MKFKVSKLRNSEKRWSKGFEQYDHNNCFVQWKLIWSCDCQDHRTDCVDISKRLLGIGMSWSWAEMIFVFFKQYCSKMTDQQLDIDWRSISFNTVNFDDFINKLLCSMCLQYFVVFINNMCIGICLRFPWQYIMSPRQWLFSSVSNLGMDFWKLPFISHLIEFKSVYFRSSGKQILTTCINPPNQLLPGLQPAMDSTTTTFIAITIYMAVAMNRTRYISTYGMHTKLDNSLEI